MLKGTSKMTIKMLPLISRHLVDEEGPIGYDPAIPVRLKAGHFVIESYGLIDTGADVCLLNRRVLERQTYAGPPPLREVELAAGIGGSLRADAYYFELEICNQQLDTIHSMGLTRFFAVEMPERLDVILGREGFLENVNELTFDYARRQLTIEFRQLTGSEVSEAYFAEAESLVRSGNYSGAVTSVSILIERLLTDIARTKLKKLTEERSAETLASLTQNLRRQRIIDDSSATTLRQFADLRNRAVHSLQPLMTSDALRALQLARQVVPLLESKHISH